MNKAIKYVKAGSKAGSLIVVLFMLCLNAKAQFDPMFTQYMNNEMFINPAYTGTRGSLSANLLYRDQWAGIPGSPKTQTFSIHSPLGRKCGLGVSIMNETIGITNQIRINGSYSFRIRTGDYSNLSFGVQGGMINHREDRNELILINENDHVFDPIPQVTVPNSGFGMYYYTDRFYVGFSIPRLLKNHITPSGVENTASMKDWHMYLTAAAVYDVSDNFKLKPSAMVKQVYGAPVQGELSVQGLVSDFWWIGAAYRSGDALSAITGFQLSPQLRVFYSYDYATTNLGNYTSGSHEVTIGYDFSFKKNKIVSPRYF